MKIILKPVSRQELGEVVIDEQLFPVGRAEQPFASYPPELVGHLSRRHARIFSEGQGAYVADLGSRNGTRLNDKAVEFKPMRLLDGDTITFANELQYQVELRPEDDDTQFASAIGLRLTLIPEGNGKLEAIQVLQFPYLISKSDPVFSVDDSIASGSEEDPRNYLSRRHAHIFARNNQLYVEDLASTNGTFLNNEQLDEHARPLNDGDELRFGADQLSYRVRLAVEGEGDDIANTASAALTSIEAAVAAEQSQAAAAVAGEHTVMVSSANSFLDIFCVEAEEEKEAEETEEEPDDKEQTAPKHSPQGKLGRMVTVGGEIREAFKGDSQADPRKRWIAAAVVVLAVGIGTSIYFSGAPLREARLLMDQEKYAEVLVLTSARLAKKPGDENMRELALEALAQHSTRQWLSYIGAGDYSGARNVLEDNAVYAGDNPTAQSMLNTLAWTTDELQFIDERGGEQAPVHMYRDEALIENLLERWDANIDEYRASMRLLLAQVPEFDAVHASSFSYLRAMRNEKSVYLGAVERLDSAVRDNLASDTPANMRQAIDAAERQYPRIGGTAALRTDLDNYLPVAAAIAASDTLRASILIEQAGFTTPPFLDKVDTLRATLLPDADVAERYAQASQAWREGQLAQALDMMQSLAGQVGGELAAVSLQAKRDTVSNYSKLQSYRGSRDYGERLLAFHSSLDPVEDSFFINALARDFQAQRATAMTSAEQAWQQAEQNWSAYRSAGGIRGLLRLEESVSPRFTQLAALLTRADAGVRRGASLQSLLGQALLPAQQEQFNTITGELALQRRSLQELGMVLSADVLTTKLNMLGSANPATSANSAISLTGEQEHERPGRQAQAPQ